MKNIILVEDHTDQISLILQPKSKRGGLYLGSQVAATDRDLLKKYNITSIITIAAELPNKYPPHITHLKISIDDQPLANIYDHFHPSYEFIKKQLTRGNVLIHCRMGISRSASLVIAYVMRKYNISYEKAYSKVKAKRQKINPNEGFVMQLKKYEMKLYALRKKKSEH